MILKSVVRFPETNSVEATWENAGLVVKCRSYADVQMDDLEADLGADTATHASLIATVKANIQPPPPAPVIIPISITMRQARLALLAAGLLGAVNAGISAMSEAEQIEWEFAATVDRASPLVAMLAPALGLDSNALDALFTAGAAL